MVDQNRSKDQEFFAKLDCLYFIIFVIHKHLLFRNSKLFSLLRLDRYTRDQLADVLEGIILLFVKMTLLYLQIWIT